MTTAMARVPNSLTGQIVTPGDRRYAQLRSTYTTSASPAAVLLPKTTAQVVDALRYAREQRLPIAVRSGGHGFSGASSNNGGVVIDLSMLNRVQVLDERAGWSGSRPVPAGRTSRRRWPRTAW